MGTRGSIGFHKDGVDKIAYNHFDSYPEELGLAMLAYARKSVEKLTEDFDKIEMIDDSITPTPEQIKRCMEHDSVDLSVSEQKETDWYCLLRDTQGDLEATASIGYMVDYSGFLRDSVFCEWAYIVNLTSKKLEVYKGFQKGRVPPGRYGEITQKSIDHQLSGYSGDIYYGVGLIVQFSLSALPGDNVFIERINRVAGRDVA